MTFKTKFDKDNLQNLQIFSSTFEIFFFFFASRPTTSLTECSGAEGGWVRT